MRGLLRYALCLSAIALVTASPCQAYYAAILTLSKIIRDAGNIAVVEVDKVSRDKQVVIFKKVADLKGKGAPELLKHQLTDRFHPRQARTVLDWAEPGKIAIFFQSERVGLTCIGGFWYECAAEPSPWWTMTTGRPELSYAYSGSTAKLRGHVPAILAGQERIITALKYRLFIAPRPGQWGERRPENWDANEAVGARRLMRGKDWPLCRIKASLKMPNTVPEVVIQHTELILGDGPAAPEDVPGLISALKQEDARIRIEAAEDLGLVGPPAAAAVPALLKLAEQDADPLIRVEAAKAVASIDPKNETAIPMLLAALKDKAAGVRKQAAERLGDLGPRAKPAVADLIKGIADPDPAVSWAAIDALGQIGPDAESAVPTLIEALKESKTGGAAVDALGQIGHKAQAAIPALEGVLKGDDAGIRWGAACALVRIGGQNRQEAVKLGVRYLLEIGTREKEKNWTDANNILIAPSSRAALPALIDATRDPEIRELASETARDISIYLKQDPMSDVKALLQDKDACVRCVAAWSLYNARVVETKWFIAAEEEILKTSDAWARRQAARYLGALGPYGKEAAPALSAALEDRDEGVRKAAAEALKAVGPK